MASAEIPWRFYSWIALASFQEEEACSSVSRPWGYQVFFVFFTSWCTMHTYVQMALQSQITDSVEREIWWEEWGLEEGREGIKWAEEKLTGRRWGWWWVLACNCCDLCSHHLSKTGSQGSVMEKTERGPFINSWWTIIGTDMKSIGIWTRLRPEAL